MKKQAKKKIEMQKIRDIIPSIVYDPPNIDLLGAYISSLDGEKTKIYRGAGAYHVNIIDTIARSHATLRPGREETSLDFTNFKGSIIVPGIIGVQKDSVVWIMMNNYDLIDYLDGKFQGHKKWDMMTNTKLTEYLDRLKGKSEKDLEKLIFGKEHGGTEFDFVRKPDLGIVSIYCGVNLDEIVGPHLEDTLAFTCFAEYASV